ncbi:MAG: YfcC family protein [Firmicutes bacterium]|nr:YfcC family protein [Bacillota bacterium]
MKENKKKKEKKELNPIVIVVAVILLAAICTYILPAGQFERVVDETTGAEMVVPGSYVEIEKSPITLMGLLTSITLGMQGAGSIVFFLLIVGGVFGIVQETGAIHAGIGNLVKTLGNKQMLLIPVCITVFGIISSTAACCEEYLAILPLMYTACIALGFDSIIAMMLLMGVSAMGFASSLANPFTVGVAQGIAGLPTFSGIELRIALLVVLIIVTTAYVMLYGKRILKNPQLSPMYEIDKANAKPIDLSAVEKLTGRQIGVLTVFMGGFVFIAVMVITKGYYMDELSALFIAIGLICAAIAGMGPSRICDAFMAGAKDMLMAAMLVGFCKSATIILSDANVFDTLINAMGTALDGLNATLAAIGMYLLQTVFSIAVPSGSGQAAMTMPFMAPLSDLLGITRQTAVLAYQLADSFTNVVTPVSGVLMGALTICHIPWKTWFKWLVPLWGIWILVAFGFLIFAVQTNYGPF